MSLPVHSVLSLGMGIVLRFTVDYLFPTNERISGTLLGVFDGALAHIAWRSDTLLEPLVLIETVGGICFDALNHQSLSRLVALSLGIVVGIAISDTARLHLSWEDLGKKVENVPVSIKDDLNATTEALSSLSGEATYFYEKTAKKGESTTEKKRKQITAAWIEAQRRPSTSRLSTITTFRDSRMPSLSGLETRSHTSVPSLRAIKDAEYLASLTPLPPDSLADSIDIGVHPPSDISRFSSPTIKGAPGLPFQGEEAAVQQSQPQTTKATVEAVSDSSTETEKKPAHSGPHLSAKASPKPSVNEVQRSPSVREREPSVRTEHQGSPAHRRPSSRASAQPPQAIEDDSPITQSYPTPSFAYHFPNIAAAPSQSARSMASTRMTNRPAADLRNAFIDGLKERGSVYSKHSASRAEPAPTPGDASVPLPIHARSPHTERVPLGSPHSRREIIVNYDNNSTQIYIPPPPSSGTKVREVPIPVTSEGLQLHTHAEPSVSGHQSSHSPRPLIEEISLTSKSIRSSSRRSKSISAASNIDLETVPPEDDDNTITTKPSRPTSGELSSEPNPPSQFHLRTAWRDSDGPSSPSLDYSGKIIKDEGAIFEPAMNTLEADLMDRDSRPRSRSTRRMSDSSNSRRPLLRSRRRSMHSERTSERIAVEDDATTVKSHKKSPAVVETDRPSEEMFYPKAKQSSNGHTPSLANHDPHDHPASSIYSHSKQQSSSLLSSSSYTESILTRGPGANLIIEAQNLRDRAAELELQIKIWKDLRERAQVEDQPTRILTLGHDIRSTAKQIAKLHRKADKLFFAALNTVKDTDRIDVHKLKTRDAIHRTEQALYELQARGGTELEVFTATSQNRGAPLKTLIMDRMKMKYHFIVLEDEKEVGLIRIYLPPPTQKTS